MRSAELEELVVPQLVSAAVASAPARQIFDMDLIIVGVYLQRGYVLSIIFVIEILADEAFDK